MKRINNIIFLDIETVSVSSSYQELSTAFQEAWQAKANYYIQKNNISPEQAYTEKAAIYAEFGKVIVISMGFFAQDENDKTFFKIKTLSHDNEYTLLNEFNNIVNHFGTKKVRFCAHNGKEFDYPYLCRRMLVLGIPLIKPFQLLGKKPWENPHLDTMEMWRFGDYKHYTSLKTLTTVLGVPSPKGDIDGSQVGHVYYNEKDIDRISSYCQNDVIATARIFLKLTSSSIPLTDENIIISN